MKKFIYSFMLAVVGMTTALFTSCTNEESINFPIEEELAGNYKGKLEVTVDGQNLGEQSQKITVEKASEKSINLSLKNFSFIGINLGDIELNDCPLSENSGNYAFTGTTLLDTEVLKADVKATGTIGGGKVEISMDIDADLAGVKQSVKVVYTGEKLKGTESSEAKITKFIFDRNVAAVDSLVISQPVIDEESKTITFMVADTAKAEHLAALVPTIEVSEKATVTPGSGVAQNFSNGKSVEYTVVAEDGTTVVYKALIEGITRLYDFEDWKTISVEDANGKWEYEIPQYGGWTGADQALNMVRIMLQTEGIDFNEKSLMSSDDSYSGDKAAKIVTLDTHGQESIMPGFFPAIPKVTSGSMFLGTFEVNAMNTLKSTKFGIEFPNKPVSVKGYYKYLPGKDYYRCDNISESNVAVVDNSMTDEFSISVVLYEVSSYDKKNEILDGTNIYTSDKIVAFAQLSGGEMKDYKSFELQLDYKQEYSKDKLYRFAIICSSSKNGDKFSGAPGSTLIVDDIEVSF